MSSAGINRAQRRHDHEVQDHGELQERQQGDKEGLVARKATPQFLPIVNRCRRGLFSHELLFREMGAAQAFGGGRHSDNRDMARETADFLLWQVHLSEKGQRLC